MWQRQRVTNFWVMPKKHQGIANKSTLLTSEPLADENAIALVLR